MESGWRDSLSAAGHLWLKGLNCPTAESQNSANGMVLQKSRHIGITTRRRLGQGPRTLSECVQISEFYDRQTRDRHRPVDFEARQGYKIFFKKSVEKDFSSIPKKDLEKFSIASKPLAKILDHKEARN
jgi:hypothetical protein